MHECLYCGYCYDPDEGAVYQGISAGTAFEDLPDGFTCPSCGAPRDVFNPVRSPGIGS
ncbi:rubredoxin [Gemmatimonadota bacterium]